MKLSLKDAYIPLNLEDRRDLKYPFAYEAGLPYLIVNLMEQDKSGRILANPHLRVSNNVEAKINIGDRIPIVVSTFKTSEAGALTQVNYTYEEVGIKLTILPSVRYNNQVAMKIVLEISSIVEYEAVTGQPRIRTRKVETFLELNDNETSVLGGLISDEERIGNSSLPYVGGYTDSRQILLIGEKREDRDRCAYVDYTKDS